MCSAWRQYIHVCTRMCVHMFYSSSSVNRVACLLFFSPTLRVAPVETALWPRQAANLRLFSRHEFAPDFPIEQNIQNRTPASCRWPFLEWNRPLKRQHWPLFFFRKSSFARLTAVIIMAGKPDDTSSPNIVHSHVRKPGGGQTCSTGGTTMGSKKIK